MRILLLVGLVWIGASLILLLVMTTFWWFKAEEEKQRFREFLKQGNDSRPERANACYDGETFVGGTIFCSDGRAFNFRHEAAFNGISRWFGLKPEYIPYCIRN